MLRIIGTPAHDTLRAARSRVPIAFAHERRLLHEEYASSRSVSLTFHMRLGASLSGRVDPRRVGLALNRLVARHAALRTSFRAATHVSTPERRRALWRWFVDDLTLGEPLFEQYVHRDAKMSVDRHDLRDLPEEAREGRIASLIEDVYKAPFDYARPPLMRAVLVRRSHDEWLLVLVISHLVCDAESAQIILRGFLSAYHEDAGNEREAVTTGWTEVVSPAGWYQSRERAYVEGAVSHWQRVWNQLEHCQVSWADCPVALPPSFAAIGPDPTRQLSIEMCTNDRHCLSGFSDGSDERLRALALAGAAMTLRRLTGQPTVALWTHLSTRGAGQHDAVGWFVHDHLIGIDMCSDVSGDELVRQAAASLDKAHEHRDLSVAQLWRLEGRTRESGLRFVCNVYDGSSPHGEAGDLTLRRVRLPGVTFMEVACRFAITRCEESLAVSIAYSTALFAPQVADRILRFFTDAVVSIARSPMEPISSSIPSCESTWRPAAIE